MRKIILLVLIFILIAGTVAGCNLKPRLLEPELGEHFELPIGPDALIQGEDVRLTLLEIVEDSRCPLGVECVTAGQAVYTLTVEKSGTTQTLTLVEEGLGGEGRASFMEYNIIALLQPYPSYPDAIRPDEYYLDIIVTK